MILLGFLLLHVEVTQLRTPERINETVAKPVRSVSSVTIRLNFALTTATDTRTLLLKQSNQQGVGRSKKETSQGSQSFITIEDVSPQQTILSSNVGYWKISFILNQIKSTCF